MLQDSVNEHNLCLRKDCEVEVCSEDEGFKGAWYRAILEENSTKSGRKKLKVRYTTLLQDDFSTLLTESVEQRLIRPVPPEDLNEEVEFEEGSVVDADLKDGWWMGLIVRKMEDDKFLVYFDSPPDVIQFERKQLRAHHDWIDSKWIRPQNKELSKSLFTSGTMVEVRCKTDKSEADWIPALIVNGIEENGVKKFIVKFCNNNDELKLNIIVDACDVRPKPPPFSVEKYKLLDRVDAFHGSGWRKGLVRGIHSEKRYTVSFGGTKKESVFKHSDLRPSKEWKDGVWRQGTKRKLGKETPSDSKRKRLLVGDKVKLSHFLNTKKNISRDGSTFFHEEHKLKENSPKRKQEQKNNSIIEETVCNGSETLITNTSDVICDDDYGQTLSAWCFRVKSSTGSDKSKLSPDRAPKAVQKSSGDDENDDIAMVLPFAKQSPIWKELESMEVFKTVKQSPHFSPLLETREEFREGSAAAEMVKFVSLSERVKNLKLNVDRSTLERLKECFYELEKYGFNVTSPISRINMLFSLKDQLVNGVKELEYKEKKMTKKVNKKKRIEEDLRAVEQKIIELRSQEAELKEKKDASEKEIAETQSCVEDLDKKIQDMELEFQSVASAPW